MAIAGGIVASATPGEAQRRQAAVDGTQMLVENNED
jgi:hypothetical protein